MAEKPTKYYDYTDKLSFKGKWYNYETGCSKQFIINFYPSDNTVDMFDIDIKRIYLKRVACEGLEMKDMFVGNKVRIYGRQIMITEYADCKTQERVGKTKEHTFAVLKPLAVEKLGEVINQIEDREFQICRMKMCNLTRIEALAFYERKKGDSFLPFMVEHLVSGPIVALELVGVNALERWKEVIGPKDPSEARKVAPHTLRAIYGVETASNGFHGADNYEEAIQSACFFFPEGIDKKPPPGTAQIKNSTCCVIKPHAIKERKLGNILGAIMSNPKFKVTALQMFYLTTPNATEFLEVYKGVVSDFHALVLSFIDGPCVVLEISAKEEAVNAYEEFRQFAGPADSDIARQIRPNSLRGMFGNDKYNNAIHCTDLPEDTQLELEYFFKILFN